MFITKTKKALCLSLVVSLTTQISAEGWTDTLKSWVTPKTVGATAAIAARLLCQASISKQNTPRTINFNQRATV